MWMRSTRTWKLADAPRDALMIWDKAIWYVYAYILAFIHVHMHNQSILLTPCPRRTHDLGVCSLSTRTGWRSNAGWGGWKGGGRACSLQRVRTWLIARTATGMNGTTTTCCHRRIRISASIPASDRSILNSRYWIVWLRVTWSILPIICIGWLIVSATTSVSICKML